MKITYLNIEHEDMEGTAKRGWYIALAVDKVYNVAGDADYLHNDGVFRENVTPVNGSIAFWDTKEEAWKFYKKWLAKHTIPKKKLSGIRKLII